MLINPCLDQKKSRLLLSVKNPRVMRPITMAVHPHRTSRITMVRKIKAMEATWRTHFQAKNAAQVGVRNPKAVDVTETKIKTIKTSKTTTTRSASKPSSPTCPSSRRPSQVSAAQKTTTTLGPTMQTAISKLTFRFKWLWRPVPSKCSHKQTKNLLNK